MMSMVKNLTMKVSALEGTVKSVAARQEVLTIQLTTARQAPVPHPAQQYYGPAPQYSYHLPALLQLLTRRRSE